MQSLMKGFPSLHQNSRLGGEGGCVYTGGLCVESGTKKLDVKISTDYEGRASCKAVMSTSKRCQ